MSMPTTSSSGEFEFNDSQNQLIGDLARKMALVGFVMLFFGLLQMINGISSLILSRNPDRMIAALKRHGMILTAYCPVARGKLLDDPDIGKIAKARGKTHAQICLRWLVQQPMVAAVPRALEERHISENLDVFDFSLSDEEMRSISALRKNNIRIADPPERAPKWDVETVA